MIQRINFFLCCTLFVFCTSCDKEECDIGSQGCSCTTLGETCDAGLFCNPNSFICERDAEDEQGKFTRKELPCGGVADAITGLQWENPPMENPMTYDEAVKHCASYEGFWKLPSLEELRTLVSDDCGPIGPLPDGDCKISSTSVDTEWDELTCFGQNNGCAEVSIRPQDCLWQDWLYGKCTSYYWTESTIPEEPDRHWVVDFADGSIFNINYILRNRQFFTRCVCSVPSGDTATDSDSDSDSSTQ